MMKIQYNVDQTHQNFLVSMKVDIRNQNFENIRIKNTSLLGANFVR
ncbi:unnamed protein product [Paramecium pentaurelia]|uniref:Uncharacterized protein n=1 Tax=Paramecium pentaurelia TaxID=43138 RepID=A0A8S1WPX1_9CILI|nr:unnamed protein product [Paramecium pentaurelia]